MADALDALTGSPAGAPLVVGRYQTHRSDGNADDLERAATDLGLTVYKIGRPVDWLVFGFGLAVACEVKTAKGKPRPGQIVALKAAGAAGWVLRTVEDVIAVHRELRFMASVLARVGWPKETKGRET